MSTSTTARPVKAIVLRGGVAGMIAGAAMAMFAMVASVTSQHHGFFTPLFHTSALFGLVLGALALRTAPADAATATAEVRGARSAMLSR
jgi:hypothetical protein